MPPVNPHTIVRRGILVVAAAGLFFLAGHAIYVAKALAAWDEPQRSLKAGSAVVAGLLGLLYVAVLARDFRGKPAPASGMLLPVFLVVGGNWISDGYRLHVTFFIVIGLVAVLLGAWGLFTLLIRLRHSAH
jgi:hypothetical protein